jgi:hypothetical protein
MALLCTSSTAGRVGLHTDRVKMKLLKCRETSPPDPAAALQSARGSSQKVRLSSEATGSRTHRPHASLFPLFVLPSSHFYTLGSAGSYDSIPRHSSSRVVLTLPASPNRVSFAAQSQIPKRCPTRSPNLRHQGAFPSEVFDVRDIVAQSALRCPANRSPATSSSNVLRPHDQSIALCGSTRRRQVSHTAHGQISSCSYTILLGKVDAIFRWPSCAAI